MNDRARLDAIAEVLIVQAHALSGDLDTVVAGREEIDDVGEAMALVELIARCLESASRALVMGAEIQFGREAEEASQ